MVSPFRDRTDAGRQLASAVAQVWPPSPGTLVLGLPRGGVPVALEVADRLAAPLDVLVVRKLRAPGRPELAMGAVGPGGVVVVEDDVVAGRGIGLDQLRAAIEAEELARARLERELRGERPPPGLAGRDLVLVDDGLATGASARAAVRAARAAGAGRVLLAVPVGAPAAVEALQPEPDALVCLREPVRFTAVGRHYVEFDQVASARVRAMLDR